MDYRDLSLLGERIGYIVSWFFFFFFGMVVYFELKSMKNFGSTGKENSSLISGLVIFCVFLFILDLWLKLKT